MSLRVVHESSGDDTPRIDFVAVHGLNFRGTANHGTSTWEKEGKIWFRDFLPEILSIPARIMLYEYNSSPAINAAAMSLDDHARKLLLLLDLKRRGHAAQRPLAFICHSLGGILVKEALVEATLDGSYSDILNSTQLLVFFGTPHRGGNLASVGEYVAKLYRAMVQNPGNDMVDALREASNSATKRYEQFRHKLEDFLVISCFETLPYSKATGIIVDKHSATLNLPGKREKQIPIEADHSAMCKFASSEDSDCETIMAVIASQLELALTTFVDTRQLLARLNYPNRRAREAQIKNVIKQDDTFEWIWTSPFATWLSSSDQIFWIRGKPASGKSTLINHISQDLRLQEKLQVLYGTHKSLVITFYFDFRQGTTLANTVKGMLLTILHSLVSQVSRLAATLRAEFPDWQNIYQDGEWDLAALQRAVSRSLSNIGRPVCLFLDGLDEFCGSNEEQLDLALYLQELPFLGNINVCFASRPHDVMNRVFGCGAVLDMQDWNLPGLVKYVFKAFDKIRLASNQLDAAHADHLSDLIAQMAEGVFLWTKFAVEDIIELWKKQELDFASLLLKLAQIPREVETLWDKRREQLNDSEREAGSVLLRTVCSAARPLCVVELVDIIQRQIIDQEVQQLLIGSQDPVQHILRLSCGLLETKNDPKRTAPGYRTVLLVHKSVRRYIETKGWWLSKDEFKNPEQMWLDECASLIDSATHARERSLCYQHKSHNMSNPVCKSYGCYKDYPLQGFPRALYEELHGGIERAITNNATTGRAGFMSGAYNLIKRRRLTFMKRGMIKVPLIAYVFHWFAYHAWILEKRRQTHCFPATSPILCPELIILMSSFRHHSCAFCDTSLNPSGILFHGASDLLPAFVQRPPIRRNPRKGIELGSGEVNSETGYAQEQFFTEQLAHSLFVSDNFVHAEGDETLESPNMSSQLSVSGRVAAVSDYICLMDFTRLHVPTSPSQPIASQGDNYIRGPPKQRKIAVVGSLGAGKSSLIVQFVDGHYLESYYPTIENTFSKVIRYHGQDFATEIVDSAGQDEYSILNSKHFIGIHGYMLIYSVQSKGSFEMIQVIRDKILNHLGAESVPIVVVGNHSEARPEQRQVTYSEGKLLAEKFQCAFVETSSRYNENVSLAFELIIAQIEKLNVGLGEPVAPPSSCTTM